MQTKQLMLHVEVCALYLTQSHIHHMDRKCSQYPVLSLFRLLLPILKKQNLANINLQFLLTSFLVTAISKRMSVPVAARSKA